MATLDQARAANAQRIAAGGETGTGVGLAPPPTAQNLVSIPAPPQLDLPIGLPQRGIFPANTVLASDRSANSREFRSMGMRSSTFPFAAAQPSIKHVETIKQIVNNVVQGSPGLFLETNGVGNQNQNILNLTGGTTSSAGVNVKNAPDGTTTISVTVVPTPPPPPIPPPSIIVTPDWVNVKSFGAVGNGQFIAGGIMTAGSKILTINTSTYPESQFDPLTSTGNQVLVQGAGPGGADLWSTIASYQSPSQVTLSNAASTSVPTGTQANIVIGGTDDTVAIQNAINAAAAANLPAYIPSGVYLISAPLVYTATTVFVPPAIIGDGSFSTLLVWNNPALVGPSTGTFSFSFELNPFSMRGLSVVGNTLPTGTTPTAGAEVLIDLVSVGPIEDVVILGTSFQNGLDIRLSGGAINNCYDAAQSLYKLDGSTAKNCTASAFTFGDSRGALGGTVEDCIALGDWNAEACFKMEFSQEDTNAPITFINCYSVGGAFGPVVPVGYKTRACTLINCTSALSLIPFWADISQTSGFIINQTLINCSSLGVGGAVPAIASCVVGSFLPWMASVPYSLGWQFIDPNGFVQKVTTAGTTGSSEPSWNATPTGTTTDGGVTWTNEGTYTPANGGAITTIQGFAVAEQAASNSPYGLWKTGGQRVYLKYDGAATKNYSGSAPILVTGLTASLPTADLLSDPISFDYTEGLYQISWYLICTTAGSAGTATPSFTWNDENGAQSSNGTALSLSSTGHQSGLLVVRSITPPIQSAVTVAGASGSPVYNYFAAVTQVA